MTRDNNPAAVSRFDKPPKLWLAIAHQMWGQRQEDQHARDWGLYQEGSRLLGKMQGYVQGHTPLETDRTCHLERFYVRKRRKSVDFNHV